MKKDGQEPSRMDRKKVEMRNKIIGTAIGLIQANGFEATTMEEIAKETDIAKGTLYNYYPVKEAIISAYIRQMFETKNSFRAEQLKTLPDTRSRMIYAINSLMDGVKLQKELFEKYLIYVMRQVVSFDRKEDEGSGIAGLIVDIIALGQQGGDMRKDIPTAMIVDFFIFIFIEIAKQYYRDSESFNQNDIVDRGVDFFMKGVQPAAK